MLLLSRLPGPLTCALFAISASAEIVINPSNTSTDGRNGRGGRRPDDVNLTLQNAERDNLTQLVPLTREAATGDGGLEGNLHRTNEETVSNLALGEIAYISCNPDDYRGNLDAVNVFEQAFGDGAGNLTAVILYSTASDYCDFDASGASANNLRDLPVMSMSNRNASRRVLDNIDDLAPSRKYFVKIARSGDDGDGGAGQQGGRNPLGPSPSTAVAMIILYSITGIITALFLVIIITGAVRAHRHPDRYGPRDVLGRPRQSRAKGLGRAILDTLPIVKFGERDPQKPADVELGSTAETREVNSETDAQGNNQTVTETQQNTANNDTAPAPQQSGIAPAEPMAAGAAGGGGAVAASNNPSNDEGLGCSICTEDFEKGQDIRVLPCDHKFHPDCVDPWLLNVSGTCPLCRVDLRPETSRTSSVAEDDDSLAPPLQPEEDVSHRRRSALRDILSLRARPNASAEERISALRRLRDQRRNMSGDAIPEHPNGGSSEDVANQRRSKRMSARLSSLFGERSRRGGGREDSPPPAGESSGSAQQQPRRDESPDNDANEPSQPESNARS